MALTGSRKALESAWTYSMLLQWKTESLIHVPPLLRLCNVLLVVVLVMARAALRLILVYTHNELPKVTMYDS